MDVTVSIVCGGDTAPLLDCLASLPAAAGGCSSEVVVVDNASQHSLGDVAERHPEVRIVRSERRLGFGANHNAATADARGRHLFVLNDDTLLHPGCIDRLVRFLDQNPALAVAGPRIYHGDGRQQPSAFHFPTPARVALTAATLQRAGWVLSAGERIRRVDWVHGAALMVRTQAFREVGGFDERFFMYLEDVDLCRRLRDRGWEVAFFPPASLVHLENRSTAAVPEQRVYQHARSRSLYAAKHHGTAGRRAVIGMTVAMWGGRVAAAGLLGRPRPQRALFRAQLRAARDPHARPAVEDAAADHNQQLDRVAS
ncbi:MAG TPA: glycosyltransferase family 2 protein [Gaiellales bacterium]|nr:glycosyltransferase family 2 protein [Gaiellales bacterium]